MEEEEDLIEVTDRKLMMHSMLRSNLNDLKLAVKKKWDGVLLIDGLEGSGKTTLGAEICYYLSYRKGRSNFTIDNIIWTPDQFEKIVQKAKPGTAILWDEFVFGGLSTEAMGQVQNALKKYFTLIRKKRLYIILILPYFFMGTKYFTIARSRALIHVYTPDGIRRGYFKFYNYVQKKYLYIKGFKFWDYPKNCKSSFDGVWKTRNLGELGIDEEEYDRRKEKAIKTIYQKKNKDKNVWRDRFYKLIRFIKVKLSYEWKEMANEIEIGMSSQALQRGYSRYREKQMDKEHEESEKKMMGFKMPGRELEE